MLGDGAALDSGSLRSCGDPAERLEAVLEAFALISHERHASELVALLHRARTSRMRTSSSACSSVTSLPRVRERASSATMFLQPSLPSNAAVRRLVQVTLAGLHPLRKR